MSLGSWYAQQAELNHLAEQEANERGHLGLFQVDPGIDDWAAEVISPDNALATLPLVPDAKDQWLVGLGLPLTTSPGVPTYYGRLLNEILAAALRDNVLVPPERGAVAIAFALRDPQTEEENALGYGFWPASAQAVSYQASSATPYELLAGGPDAKGATSVSEVVRIAANQLRETRSGYWPNRVNVAASSLGPTSRTA